MDSDAWDARYAAASGLVWTGEPNRYVVQELAGLPAGRALDLAAGEGRNAVWLAAQGWRVTAIDFSPVAVDRANSWAASEAYRWPGCWLTCATRRLRPAASMPSW